MGKRISLKRMSGFVEGSFPMTYLGEPIVVGQLTARCKARMEGQRESVEGAWLAVMFWLRNILDKMNKEGVASRLDLALLEALGVCILAALASKPRLIYWKKPKEGRVKLNMDGNCRGNPSSCEGEGIIRDGAGRLIVGFSNFFGHGTNNEAELRALAVGVQLCKNLGFLHVEIECD
ncbi:uncharacterized protein LOC118344046 [Juglans regia]|uniref:Uncharacterized protein LOC118344046 n=1 Tax=Juglans regia TaxID=51240 RepID=A0A6P9DX18_JUGRE|nr:uncharacterized protein LOC118344046 [Juglans regia]